VKEATMAERIEVSAVIEGVAPEDVFDAWVDGPKHAAMTGAAAQSDARAGGRFTAWDGYIEGTHVELDRPRRIVQRWRSAEFPEGAPDSRLEVRLDEASAGTRITIVHSDIPNGQGAQYEAGWAEHYFDPMRAFFGN
jgi:activator of HSP90 ATPase